MIIEYGQYNADIEDVEYFSKIKNLIEKQQKEIDKKDKVIDLMAEEIEDETTMENYCNREDCYADEYIDGHCQKCLNCIIKYFTKEAEVKEND